VTGALSQLEMLDLPKKMFGFVFYFSMWGAFFSSQIPPCLCVISKILEQKN